MPADLSLLHGWTPPHRTPALQESGHFDIQWAGYFDQIYRRTRTKLPNTGYAVSGLADSGLVSLPAIQDTRANRVKYDAGAYLGWLYYETDTTLWYLAALVANVPTWVYSSGTWAVTQANIPVGLGTADTGLLVNVTDFGHVLQWGGAAWGWGPGENGSGYMMLFEVDPTGAGWHLYDGTNNVAYLKADGTTATVNLPDLTSVAANAAFLVGGSPNGGPNAAVAPVFTGNALTPAGTISNDTDAGGTSAAAAGNTYALKPHTHTFTGTPVTPTGTVDATGKPRNIVRRPWFRQ